MPSRPGLTPARAVKTLFALWVGASLSVLPYPLHTRTYHYLSDPRHSDERPLADSLVCNIPLSWMARMKYVVQASTLLLFVAPMCVMTVLYTSSRRCTRHDGAVHVHVMTVLYTSSRRCTRHDGVVHVITALYTS